MKRFFAVNTRVLLLSLSMLVSPAFSLSATYEVGWFHWDPYIVEHEKGGVTRLTGLNVEMANAVFERMDLAVEWNQVVWKSHLERMEAGTSAIAVGASKTKERETYAWFSEPFITESIVLLSRNGQFSDVSVESAEELLAYCRREGLRVAYVEGYYYGEEVKRFIDSLPGSKRVATESDAESLQEIIEGNADVLIADRLVATTIAWRADMLGQVEVHPKVLHESGLHVMFSKKVFDASVRDAYNAAFASMQKEGDLSVIQRRYMLPVLLGITLHTNWFVWIGMIGVSAFAISGVLLARREGYDVFGALVLASLPALGGGVVRDLLTDRHPILLFRSNLQVYIFIVVGVVVVATLFYKAHDWWILRRSNQISLFNGRFSGLPMKMVGVCDALGLSAFIISGVVIAVEQQCEPLWLWGSLIAALTGAGGGILRDIVRADAENPMIKGEFYPEIALLWGFIFSIFLEWQATRLNLSEIGMGVFATMLAAFVMRLLVIRFGIRSLLLSKQSA